VIWYNWRNHTRRRVLSIYHLYEERSNTWPVNSVLLGSIAAFFGNQFSSKVFIVKIAPMFPPSAQNRLRWGASMDLNGIARWGYNFILLSWWNNRNLSIQLYFADSRLLGLQHAEITLSPVYDFILRGHLSDWEFNFELALRVYLRYLFG
jgi:hypothetical protein